MRVLVNAMHEFARSLARPRRPRRAYFCFIV
jgi:hypothetical protein